MCEVWLFVFLQWLVQELMYSFCVQSSVSVSSLLSSQWSPQRTISSVDSTGSPSLMRTVSISLFLRTTARRVPWEACLASVHSTSNIGYWRAVFCKTSSWVPLKETYSMSSLSRSSSGADHAPRPFPSSKMRFSVTVARSWHVGVYEPMVSVSDSDFRRSVLLRRSRESVVIGSG